VDYQFLDKAYYEAELENGFSEKDLPELFHQQLYQQANHRMDLYEHTDAVLNKHFGGSLLPIVASIQKVIVDADALQVIAKHTEGRFAKNPKTYVLPTIRTRHPLFRRSPHEITLGLTSGVSDIENHTVDADTYAEACMRWNVCDGSWLAFDAELFTSVHNSSAIRAVIENLKDPPFRATLRQFLHRAVGHYQETNTLLNLDKVAFSKDASDTYYCQISSEFNTIIDLGYLGNRPLNTYLLDTSEHLDLLSHHEFLTWFNYQRTIQGLLAAVGSPLYRHAERPPLWRHMAKGITRHDWVRLFHNTKKVFQLSA
jgi:hypothetical protein